MYSLYFDSFFRFFAAKLYNIKETDFTICYKKLFYCIMRYVKEHTTISKFTKKPSSYPTDQRRDMLLACEYTFFLK